MRKSCIYHECYTLRDNDLPYTSKSLERKLEIVSKGLELSETEQETYFLNTLVKTFSEEIDYIYDKREILATYYNPIDLTQMELFKWLCEGNNSQTKHHYYKFSLLYPMDYSLRGIEPNELSVQREYNLMYHLGRGTDLNSFRKYKLDKYQYYKINLMCNKSEINVKKWIGFHLFKLIQEELIVKNMEIIINK